MKGKGAIGGTSDGEKIRGVCRAGGNWVGKGKGIEEGET